MSRLDRCFHVVPITVPHSAVHTTVKCGASFATTVRYCQPCQAYYEEEYPQGWSSYAGDTCVHGVYTGGIGIDYLCNMCEGGYTERVYCEEEGCNHYEWGDYTETFKLYHVPNPARTLLAKDIMSMREFFIDKDVLSHPEIRKWLWGRIKIQPKREIHVPVYPVKETA